MEHEYFNWHDLPKHANKILDNTQTYYLCHKHYPGYHFVIGDEKYRAAILNNTLYVLPAPPRHRLVSPYIFDEGDMGWFIYKGDLCEWVDIRVIALAPQPEEEENIIRVRTPGEPIIVPLFLFDEFGNPVKKEKE